MKTIKNWIGMFLLTVVGLALVTMLILLILMPLLSSSADVVSSGHELATATGANGMLWLEDLFYSIIPPLH